MLLNQDVLPQYPDIVGSTQMKLDHLKSKNGRLLLQIRESHCPERKEIDYLPYRIRHEINAPHQDSANALHVVIPVNSHGIKIALVLPSFSLRLHHFFVMEMEIDAFWNWSHNRSNSGLRDLDTRFDFEQQELERHRASVIVGASVPLSLVVMIQCFRSLFLTLVLHVSNTAIIAVTYLQDLFIDTPCSEEQDTELEENQESNLIETIGGRKPKLAWLKFVPRWYLKGLDEFNKVLSNLWLCDVYGLENECACTK
ncbi:hypothetical protein Tco_1274467 [Tanacetum coccineum]